MTAAAEWTQDATDKDGAWSLAVYAGGVDSMRGPVCGAVSATVERLDRDVYGWTVYALDPEEAEGCALARGEADSMPEAQDRAATLARSVVAALTGVAP